jgi:hypothetical protein
MPHAGITCVQVTVRQLTRQFGGISQGALEGYLGRLTEQGMLAAVPNSRSYRVIAALVAAQVQEQQVRGTGRDPMSVNFRRR